MQADTVPWRSQPVEARMGFCNSALLSVFPAILALCAGIAAGEQQSPAGKLFRTGESRAEASIFESGTLTQGDGESAPAFLFDPSVLPSGYATPYVENWEHKHLKITRPLDGASFPRNIAAPKIHWEDLSDNVWMVSVKAPGWSAPLRVVTDRPQWRPDASTWESIKASGTGEWVELEVRGCVERDGKRVGDEVYVDRRRFRVSPYEADPLVVFRFVSPLFHGFKTPDVCYRDISNYDLRMFLPSKGAYCTNCHSFPNSPAPGSQDLPLAIAVRKSFSGLRLLGLYDFGTQAGKTLAINSFFMCWDAEGKRVAVTSGQSVLVRSPITLETQEFHVVVGDILIVDTETFETTALPGASEPEFVETFPAWSPDGKTIVFARDKEIGADQVMPVKRYSLYKVPYNNGEGGEITPLKGAADGMSNFAPRYSPDGKWLVFCKGERASLVEPTADLWIISTEEGAEARMLECNCDHATDSHHSWSSNSRWLLFASKRDDGIFARIYLTEIDEEGHASPPVELPALDEPMMCYNVPEFLQYRPRIDSEDILRKVSFVQE